MNDIWKHKKRLFLGLLSVSVFIFIIVVAVVAYLIINRQATIYHFAFWVVTGALLFMLAVVSFGIVGMVLTLWSARTFPTFKSTMRVANGLMFPFVFLLSKIFNIDIDDVKSSYIEVNNGLVKADSQKYRPRDILILAPHCLQWSECPHKITIDVKNCKRCGKCAVDALRKIQEQYGVLLVVATGGTLARKFIKEYKPLAIIAVACERDLTSGIQDVTPLPVLGVLNDRPNGPCYNTWVNISEVEKAIWFYLGKE
jgi:hypothetical protein